MKRYLSISFLLMFFICFCGFQHIHASDSDSLNNPFIIHDVSQVDMLMKIKYGDQEDQVGFKPHGNEGDIGTGATSFYVKNGTFYILDNVNKRIFITDNKESQKTVEIKDGYYLEDILVNDNMEIFVLDSGKRMVTKLSQDGKLLNEYNVPENIEVPTGLGLNVNGELTVNQSQDIVANLQTGNELFGPNLYYKEEYIGEKTGKINVYENGKAQEVTINFEHSFGGITVNSFKGDQLVYTKTEVAPDIPLIMAESHVYVADNNGQLGAVRIPLEKMHFAPRHLVRTDNNKIYLLSPESEFLVVYELKPGKKFDKMLAERIHNFKINNPEEMESLFKNHNEAGISATTGPDGYLHRADASSRAQQMINHKWTLKSGNNKQVSGTTLPRYVANASIGTSLTGIPYTWGGTDGVIGGAGRNSFDWYASNGYQTGDIQTSTGSQIGSVTGVDCAGFVQLAWYRTTGDYYTGNLNQITHAITKSSLKSMDALNQSGFHVVLYDGNSSNGIYTKEATTDGTEKAQSYSRTWYWLETTRKFVPIRYNRIVDDGIPLPIQ